MFIIITNRRSKRGSNTSRRTGADKITFIAVIAEIFPNLDLDQIIEFILIINRHVNQMEL